jgi:putative solute:sodium symporter small subunit
MPEVQPHSPTLTQRKRRLTVILLGVWLIVSFVPAFMARELAFEVWGWPLHFWLVAQGSVLAFMAVVAVYAWLMNRWEAQENPTNE